MSIGVSGDTRIAVADGRNFVEIEKLVGSVVPIYCFNGNIIDICWANSIQKLGGEEIYETVLDDETSVFTTKDQEFMSRDRSYCKFGNLYIGHGLMPLNKRIDRGYVLINLNNRCCIREHRLFLKYKLGRELLPHPEEVTHHINENRQDNRWENLEVMSKSRHSTLHARNMTEETRTKMSASHCGKHHSTKHRANIGAASKVVSDQTRRTKILIQAKWMIDNEYPIALVYWNTYKEQFYQETNDTGFWYKTAMKYFGTQEELIKALDDNHKAVEFYKISTEDVYTIHTNIGNFAILTSDMSGIILGSE